MKMNKTDDAAVGDDVAHPDFLYIGLQRTGSTLLRGYLTAHPDVIWTREGHRLQSTGLVDGYLQAAKQARREFAKDWLTLQRQPAVWVDMYESLGMGYRLLGIERWRPEFMMSRAELVGSNRIDLERRDTMAFIRKLMPTIRIVLTIRNQPDWIFSNYHHFISHMPQGARSFVDFLGTVEGRIVAATAHFDGLIDELHSVFGRGNVLVLPLEETARAPAQALGKLSTFLGLSAIPFTPSDRDLNRGIDHLYGRERDAIEIAQEPTSRLPAVSVLSRARRLWPRAGEANRATASVASQKTLRREFGPLLAAIYGASNARLIRLVDFDVRALGYPV
jgi:hypothetical protein